MDEVDQIISAEREKSQNKLMSRKAILRPFGLLLLATLVLGELWLAFDMFAFVDRRGLLLLFLTIALILTILYLLLRFFSNNKLVGMLIRVGGVLIIGYTIVTFVKHYPST